MSLLPDLLYLLFHYTSTGAKSLAELKVTYSVFVCLFLLIIVRLALLVYHNLFVSSYLLTLDYIFITQQGTLVDLKIFGR